MVVTHDTERRRNVQIIFAQNGDSVAGNYVCEFTYETDCHILVVVWLALQPGKFQHFVCKNFVKPESHDAFDVSCYAKQA